ncbi:MAG: MBL fold metallo-hydrolase [Candidatus Heimdallarchaeota archaeon]
MKTSNNSRDTLEVVFLGTSGAIRVPSFPSHCEACAEATRTPRARRLRSTLGIFGRENLIFDCGPDMGQIISEYDISSIARVFLTHWHADHVFGLGDLDHYAILARVQKIPIFIHEELLAEFQNVYGFTQRLEAIPFKVKVEIVTPDMTIVPLYANHETLTVGYFLIPRERSSTLAYFPDTRFLPEETVAYLRNKVTTLIIDGTWGSTYPTINEKVVTRGHLTIADAAREARKINSQRTLITHISPHTFQEGTLKVQKLKFLEEVADSHGVELAYDGMRFTI